MTYKQIAIVAPAELPIPAVLSGGIEQLITNLINENEAQPEFCFFIISNYHSASKPLEKKYKYTHFINLNNSIVLRNKFIRRAINFIDRKYFSKWFKYEHCNTDIKNILRVFRKNNFDKVWIAGNDNHIKPISTVVAKDKIIYYQCTLLLSRMSDFKLVNKIFVGCDFGKQALLNRCDLLKDNQFRLLQSGIDIDLFNPFYKNDATRDRIRKKHNLYPDIPVVCYVGRISKDKGIYELLQAAVKLKGSCSFKLLVIGSFGLSFGSKRKKNLEKEKFFLDVMSLIKELGEVCVFTGFVNDSELIDYISISDIGAVPSIIEDISPLTNFQFLAMGIPTIVSDAGGIPEYYSEDYSIMVKRGQNFVNEFSDAIKKLIGNQELRMKMGSAALKNRNQLSSKRYFSDVVRLLKED